MSKNKSKTKRKHTEEYLTLREELMQIHSSLSNLITLFYAFMATFLVFALTQGDSIYILISYMVILPTYLIAIAKMRSLHRIAAYLQVFLEKDSDSFKLETHLSKYNDTYYKRSKLLPNHISTHFPFIFSSIIVTALFFYQEISCSSQAAINMPKSCICIILLIVTLAVMYTNRITDKEKYIRRWEKIKEKEDTI